MAELNVEVKAEVRFAVDEKTAVWLESIGWRRPIEEQEVCCTCSSREIGPDGDLIHAQGCNVGNEKWQCGDCGRWLESAVQFCNHSNVMKRCAARNLLSLIKASVPDPDQVDELLRLCDVDMKKLMVRDCGC